MKSREKIYIHSMRKLKILQTYLNSILINRVKNLKHILQYYSRLRNIMIITIHI